MIDNKISNHKNQSIMKNLKFFGLILGFLLVLIFGHQKLHAQISWSNTCGSKPAEGDQFDESLREMVQLPDTIIIPVVFHILTQGGVENISKEQVLDALRKLNDDYSNRNPDTLDIPAPFKNVRGNPKIEFRLARIDPQGNCTNGIDRIYTPYTYGPGGSGNHFNLQPLFDWDHKRYMNIYVVNWIEIPNDFRVAGIAYITPVSSVPSHPEFNDALTIIYQALSKDVNILTHEMGHYVSLFHPWGPNDVGFPSCDGDDLVADTPKQKEPNYFCPAYPHISCNNGPYGDMFNNYMDYATCTNMFSRGQTERTRSCLGIHPWRKDQWTETNHIKTGVRESLPPCEKKPVADFGYGNWANWNGAGTTVRFNEACSWDPESFYWEFEGGNPSNATEKFPKVIFQDTGFHKVTLIATGTLGADTISRNIYISPAEIVYDATMTETFENEETAGNLVLFNLRGTDWKLTDKAAKTGTKSFYNPGNSQYLSGFFTHIFDLGSSPQAGRKLTFDVALGMSASGSGQGGLRITWKRPDDFDRAAIFGDSKAQPLVQGDAIPAESLKTATTNTAFVPNGSQWKNMTLPIPDNLTGKIQIHFDWGNFIQTTVFKGLYIDNIRISNTNSTKDSEFKDLLFVYPNPACDRFTIDLPQNAVIMNAIMTVYDIYGKVVMAKKVKDNAASHDISSLGSGIYVIELRQNEKIFRNKLLITK